VALPHLPSTATYPPPHARTVRLALPAHRRRIHPPFCLPPTPSYLPFLHSPSSRHAIAASPLFSTHRLFATTAPLRARITATGRQRDFSSRQHCRHACLLTRGDCPLTRAHHSPATTFRLPPARAARLAAATTMRHITRGAYDNDAALRVYWTYGVARISFNNRRRRCAHIIRRLPLSPASLSTLMPATSPPARAAPRRRHSCPACNNIATLHASTRYHNNNNSIKFIAFFSTYLLAVTYPHITANTFMLLARQMPVILPL